MKRRDPGDTAAPRPAGGAAADAPAGPLATLREALRGLRDEEPSDRGLDALMAAARAQAERMARRR